MRQMLCSHPHGDPVDPRTIPCMESPFPRAKVSNMSRSHYLFTSESVSEGHPDKVCDRISDEVVDLYFREALANGFAPKDIRVACETLATTNRVVIAGETRGPKSITPEMIVAAARNAVRDIGYEQEGFHWQH